MSKSDFLEQKVLDHVLRNTPYTSPATVYVGLHTTVVGDDDSGTEVSGNGYARQSASFDRTDNTATNNAQVTFPTATGGSWGTIVAFGLYDAATNGNLLYHGLVTPNKQILEGDAAVYQPGQLSFTEN